MHWHLARRRSSMPIVCRTAEYADADTNTDADAADCDADANIIIAIVLMATDACGGGISIICSMNQCVGLGRWMDRMDRMGRARGSWRQAAFSFLEFSKDT